MEGSQPVTVMIPAGFARMEKTDTIGRSEVIYHYGGGTTFYLTTITSGAHEWIDTAMHVPKIHPNGALMFKGMTKGPLYWREVRLTNKRVGYKNVPSELEIRFDSAANYFRDQSFKSR